MCGENEKGVDWRWASQTTLTSLFWRQCVTVHPLKYIQYTCEDSRQMWRIFFLPVSIKLWKQGLLKCCFFVHYMWAHFSHIGPWIPASCSLVMQLISSFHQHPMETNPTQQQQRQAEVHVGECWQLIIIGLPLLCPSFHIPSREMAWETVNTGSLLLHCKSIIHPPNIVQEGWSV